MRLKVSLPTELVVDERVNRITAQAGDGSFCLLPRHVDLVTALVPGLLTFETTDGTEHVLAVDEGVLVKCGRTVTVSTRHAVRGADLGNIRSAVAEQFRVLDERERSIRAATALIEASLVRRFLELRHHAAG